MPIYNRGTCACCNTTPATPVSFVFVTLNIRYQYSQSGSTWYTDCNCTAAVIDVTYSDNSVVRLDVTSTINYLVHFAYSSRRKYNQGNVVVDGKTAQWYVNFGNIPNDTYDYVATLNDATTVETYPFT